MAVRAGVGPKDCQFGLGINGKMNENGKLDQLENSKEVYGK